jgi:hypothetical protein
MKSNTATLSNAPSHRASRASQRTCDAIIAGTLFDDLDTVASELYRALQYNHITVWMNADAQILYQPAHIVPDVAAGWIAGTYSMGVGATEIAEDLLQLKAERRSTGMLDD